MTLNQLRYFRAVCRYQSVTHAAESLHVSQPSVSSAIRELEREYGVTLFRRLNKSMVLTPDGRQLLENVDTLLDLEDSLAAKMHRHSLARPPLRIGIPPMIGVVVFPELFAAFRQQHPEIPFEITEHGSFHTVQQVQDGQIDLAIAITDNIDEGQINLLPMMKTRVVLAAHPQHPLAGRGPIACRDIGSHPLLLFKPDYYLHHRLAARFEQEGFRPQVLLYTNQLYTMRNFILNGSAAAFLFHDLLALEPDMMAVELANPIEIEIGLVWKQGVSLPQSAARFLQFVKKQVRRS